MSKKNVRGVHRLCRLGHFPAPVMLTVTEVLLANWMGLKDTPGQKADGWKTRW
jgi:hypothetical protein